MEKTIQYLIQWIKDYFNQNGKDSKAVIGISGGKDSTITAALLVRALGKDRVVGVLMPEGKQEDINCSYEVCDLLGIQKYEFNILNSVNALKDETLKNNLEINSGITTNMPARIRMTVLYMVAASVGGRVVNTSNRSEEYVGYSTKYGDLAGDFGVLFNYTVEEILQIGDALEELPYHLVHKVPSDGMSNQTDEEKLGFSYQEVDNYLLRGVEPTPDKLLKIQQAHLRNQHKATIQIISPNKLTF